jgi:hypothetical protein
MSQVIFKYEVKPEFTLELPRGARVLSVQVQGEKVQMWVLQQAGKQNVLERRTFCARATGVPFDSNHQQAFIGTFQFPEQALVFHLFERFESTAERAVRYLEAAGATEIK